ncbi:MAG: hypothetical protein OEQ18_15960 [Gammaproteobacteria bacterium]|nr:hypothetical protein [Gammaproteobacteria bacterium]
MATQRSWKSWSIVSVVLFGAILGGLALSQKAPAGPNVAVYESPT